jgi:hypothetical protein
MNIDPRHPLVPLSDLQLDYLLGDINAARIAERKTPGGGSGKMSYLEGWDVRRTLNVVFGFGGWSTEVSAKVLKFEDNIPKYRMEGKYPNGTRVLIPNEFNWRVTTQCDQVLYIHQLGTVYGGVAIASQTGSDPGDVGDFSIKTADTDSLKRAAVNLGTQFGLSLYNKGSLGDVVRVSLAVGQRKIDRIEMEMERLRIEKDQIKLIEQNRAALAEGADGAVVAAAEKPRPENNQRVAPAEPDGWYQEPGEEAGSTATEPPVQQAAPKAEPKPPARTKRAIDDELRAQEEASAAEEVTPEPEQGPAAALDPEIPSQAVSEAARDAAREKLRKGFTG